MRVVGPVSLFTASPFSSSLSHYLDFYANENIEEHQEEEEEEQQEEVFTMIRFNAI